MTVCVSFSGIMLYEQCPSAFQRKYITFEEKNVPEGSSPAAERGTRIHRDCELFLKGEVDELCDEAMGFESLFYAMRDERQALPEYRWAFDENWEQVEFDDKDRAQVRGILDIVYEHEGRCYVMELKTGKKYGDHVKQRSLYGLAGMLAFPGTDPITVQTIYLDGALVDETVFMRGQEGTYKYVWQRYINKCQPPQVYKQTPSWKCRFCPYHKEKGGLCNGEKT